MKQATNTEIKRQCVQKRSESKLVLTDRCSEIQKKRARTDSDERTSGADNHRTNTHHPLNYCPDDHSAFMKKYQNLKRTRLESGLAAPCHHDFDFKLAERFVSKWATKKPNWGFSGMGEITYRRTYSRLLPDGTNEQWYQTVQRVVEGTYSMLHQHVVGVGSSWRPDKAQRDAQEMFKRVFEFKFLPPGRGLWAMGTPITRKEGLFAALNNCGFVSTRGIGEALASGTDPNFTERVKPFSFLFSMSMLGVGVGFDTKGAGSFVVKKPPEDLEPTKYVIPDSRHGWSHSTALLLQSYFYGGLDQETDNKHIQVRFPRCEFDYSQIRKKGEPIKTFGGTAPGPEPLKRLHANIRYVLDSRSGEPISVTTIVDVQNMIGVCVLAGGVRRTAEIAFAPADSKEFLDLKRFHTAENPNPRMDWAHDGWGHTSNNSVYAKPGMDYSDIAERIRSNGEPGLIWMDWVRKYGRMSDNPEDRIEEPLVEGANPCMVKKTSIVIFAVLCCLHKITFLQEQSLRSYELCNLVETFPNNHDNLNDFIRTLKFAFLYAKVVTLGMTEWDRTNDVIRVNRRIGCSMTGITQFLASRGKEKFIKWCRSGYKALKGYDSTYSAWLKIPPSVKITSIKPSGTVSLLAGSTPGCHYPIARYYIRRITFAGTSKIIPCLRKAGYPVEVSIYDKNNVVVEFPVFCGDERIPTQSEVSPKEQLDLAVLLQKHWADNQVSVTVTKVKFVFVDINVTNKLLDFLG